jgi:tRNA dimethylallyltransferase
MIPLIIIGGPTAAGKSERAILLAKRLKSEIISADSMQVYRYFDIGTAKPSLNERQSVSHHLIDIINPEEEYSAGKFKKDATKIISDLHAAGKIPIIVGGTGLYIKALTKGISMAAPSSPELRKKLRERALLEGNESLHNELLKVDPIAAKKINPSDAFRIERALEVYYLTGKPISSFHSQTQKEPPKYNILYLILNIARPLLYEKINDRVDSLIKKGLVAEVRSILDRGHSSQLKPFKSIGYKQIVQHIEEGIELDEAIKSIKKETRNFAKRQLTWFRRVPAANWIEVDLKIPESADKEIYEKVKKHLRME